MQQRSASLPPARSVLETWHTDAGAGWASPFGWFVRATTHYAEALTAEGVAALATYLQRRQDSRLEVAPTLSEDSAAPPGLSGG